LEDKRKQADSYLLPLQRPTTTKKQHTQRSNERRSTSISGSYKHKIKTKNIENRGREREKGKKNE
jgi:hypothetical protein